MIKDVKTKVDQLMANNIDGHGSDHVERVYDLTLKFAKQENANQEVVALAALLHDVDDYKFVGVENASKLTNAKLIMNKLTINEETQLQVLDIIGNMGYSNYLKGIRPNTLEGHIVSDADMCDAIGASGIIRAVLYAVSEKGNGRIFEKEVFPNIDITAKEYNTNVSTHDTDGVINHFFEKLLKLKNLMLTESGKEEAINRHQIMVDFLEQFFIEENVPEWQELLDNYNKKY